MSFGESLAPLLGRLVLAWFFLTQAYHYALDWNNTAILLTMKAVPTPPVVLLLVLVGLLLGSMSLLLGFCTRAGALALFAITVAATVTMHDYWHVRAIAARDADYDIFARNVAIAGGLLLLIGMGSGRFGVDNLKKSSAAHIRPAAGAKHH
jgi:putative oxidoreductase